MAIAEVIGTAIGEAVGYAQKQATKLFTENIYDQLMNVFKQGEVTFSQADNVNEAKRLMYEHNLMRKAGRTTDSCVAPEKAQRYRSNKFRTADSSEAMARQSAIGTARGVDERRKLTINKLQRLFDYQQRAGANGMPDVLSGDRVLKTAQEQLDAGLEVQLLVESVEQTISDFPQVSTVEELSGEWLTSTSYKLTQQARVNLVKWVLMTNASERIALNDDHSRIDAIDEVVKRFWPERVDGKNTPLDDLILNIAHTPGAMKELLGAVVLRNELALDSFLQQERRLALKALRILTLLEQVNRVG